jgi:hypothetical protein
MNPLVERQYVGELLAENLTLHRQVGVQAGLIEALWTLAEAGGVRLDMPRPAAGMPLDAVEQAVLAPLRQRALHAQAQAGTPSAGVPGQAIGDRPRRPRSPLLAPDAQDGTGGLAATANGGTP